MSTLLYINSSIRKQGSISRMISREFVDKWKAAHPQGVVIERDLVTDPTPHLTEQVMGAVFTPEAQRSPAQAHDLVAADAMIAELMSADVIVIGAPMYNFTVSSSLKAWIDYIARAGVTFTYTEKGPVGLAVGKKVYVFTARGGVYTKGPASAMDFQETYLRAVLGFIGLTDVTFIHSEGLAMGDAAVESALAGSRSTIEQLMAA
ncbi:MAG TPA: FMN-dependent NADH-azoreductase [Xanthomonadaceae bacterium]|nr:FMN-dependent NADH-azoreductase [Xanthomonadaceae bacterium]